MATFNLDSYVPVNERILQFYEKYPDGSIQTEIVKDENGVVVFKAYIFRTSDDSKPCTGHAMEREGSSFINKTSHYENAETSAVGRALAMMGFEVSKAVCSREEVANAMLNQGACVTEDQIRYLFKVAGPNVETAKRVMLSHGYTSSKAILKADYDIILDELVSKIPPLKED